MSAIGLTLTVCAALGAVFEVRSAPVETPAARAFPADITGDGLAEMLVIEGRRLAAYGVDGSNSLASIELDEGTTAFDVHTIPGDLTPSLIAVRGNAIIRRRFAPGAAETPAEVLFEVETQYADPTAPPHPHVLAVTYEEQELLALPTDSRLELRDYHGALEQTFPLDPQSSSRVVVGRPFLAWPVDPPNIAPAGAVEFRVTRALDFEPHLPESLSGPSAAQLPSWRTSLRRAQEAATLPPSQWPWFPLRAASENSERVLYAIKDHTVVRIARTPPGAGTAASHIAGPPRTYPGQIAVLPESPPDFNADGYHDLLLWKAPDAGASVDSLRRMLRGGLWDIRLTVHLYVPDKGRFEPAPSSLIRCDVPAPWFLNMGPAGPLQRCVLRDFNGDGRTDLAASLTPATYALWLNAEGRFTSEPSQTLRFAAPLTPDASAVELGRGRLCVVLRSEKALHFVYAR